MPLLPMEMMIGLPVQVKKMKITMLGPGMDQVVEMTDVDVVLMGIDEGVPVSLEIHCSDASKVTYETCGDRS